MQTIKSFSVDHDRLSPGLYISRTDGDVVTYDLRMKTPNGGDYLEVPGLHTAEHLLATYVRNSPYSDSIVYAGPMGCRTGMYLLVRDRVTVEQVIGLLTDAFAFMANFEGEIPGTKRRECGNYREHDLAGCKKEAKAYHLILSKWKPDMVKYPGDQPDDAK